MVINQLREQFYTYTNLTLPVSSMDIIPALTSCPVDSFPSSTAILTCDK
jgi:hypothetical protein